MRIVVWSVLLAESILRTVCLGSKVTSDITKPFAGLMAFGTSRKLETTVWVQDIAYQE